jgi:hypothetical protein
MSDNKRAVTRKSAAKIEKGFDAAVEPAKALEKAAQPTTTPEPPKKRRGAPTTYNTQITETICVRLSQGESLSKICAEPDMPPQAVVYAWLLRHPEFAENYTRAREEQADTLADQISALADEPPRMVVDDKGIERVDHGWVQWQKNRVEARKWVAAKLKPKKYSERIQMTGDKENPLAVTVEVNQLFDSMLQNIEMNRQVDE